MYFLGERPEYTEQLFNRIRKISRHLFADLPEPDEIISLAEVEDLYQQYGSDSLYIVAVGTIQGSYEDNTVIVYEEGDLIGLTNCYDLPSLTLTSEDQVELKKYDATKLLRFVTETRERQSIWTSYLVSINAVLTESYSRDLKSQTHLSTGFLHFSKGEVIIREGDDANDVYTIMQGRADVFVEGIKVGEVLRDEIFGAMAVFTSSKRSASVIAAEDCTVLAVPKNEFVSLIQNHPETTMTLIENMARCIISLNTQLAEHVEADPSNNII
ncbi:cyclic nucleotide-binding domain-containing protein [Gynuella sp.]|uniref:cyclic nucleotide-binding domain-containing protein n=1 Tax=Gynuella sp. TaxID=2969146 RepID=UPI003D0D2968